MCTDLARALARIILLAAALLSLSGWTHGTVQGGPTPVVSCDGASGLATGVGAGTCMTTPLTCNGVADDAPAFITFNAWAVGTWQVSHAGLIGLKLPAGGHCLINGATVKCGVLNLNKCPFAGIKLLVVDGQSVLTTWDVNNTVTLGGIGLIQDNLHSVRTATANVGDTCVTATATPQGGTPNVTIFAVGNYALMSGFDTQGLWQAPFGFPPNPYYYEYKKIVSLDNATKIVCFDAPMKSTYKSTWPLFNTGSAFEVDAGGPATLYVLDSTWDTEIEFRNMTLFRTGEQVGASGRHVVFRNMTFSGDPCYTVSSTLLFETINTDQSTCTNAGNGIEIDKIVTQVNSTNDRMFKLAFQSASPDLYTMNGTTVANSIIGTPKKFVASGGSINDFQPGVSAFGRTNEVVLTNVAINTMSGRGAFCQDANWTMAGAIITIPNVDSGGGGNQNQERCFVPGTNFYWRGSRVNETGAQVVDVTQDATNTYVQISKTYPGGGFPPAPGVGGAAGVNVHPVPKITCTGTTGAAGAECALWAAGAPLYSNRVLTFVGNNGTGFPTFISWGNVVSIDLNVTNAYSGAAVGFQLSQFNNWPLIDSTFALQNYTAIVNAKIVGNRHITLSGVTGTQTGDSGLAVPDSTVSWFTGASNSSPIYNVNTSAVCPGVGCPSVTVTIQTDQGLVDPPAGLQ